jgi:hypothetical protein
MLYSNSKRWQSHQEAGPDQYPHAHPNTFLNIIKYLTDSNNKNWPDIFGIVACPVDAIHFVALVILVYQNR